VVVLLAVPILPGARLAHILIVDDEESDRVGLAAVLHSQPRPDLGAEERGSARRHHRDLGESRGRLEASKLLGAERVLEKPIDREELLRAVADVIDGRA
jgi:hypothetical protein